jgi:hypothetical protein
MDTSTLDKEAEDFVKNRLAKSNIKHAKPNFDEGGSDLLAIKQTGKCHYKSLVIQSKGRNLTNAASNIKIPSSYINEYFVCFVYLKVDEDFDDYLYCFFEEDITSWKVDKERNYTLYIPKDFKKDANFKSSSFDAFKALRIKDLLDGSPRKGVEIIFENLNSPIDCCIDLWRLTEGLPSPKITSWLINNHDMSKSYLYQDVFVLYVALAQGGDHEHAVDWMFRPLARYTNCFSPVTNDIIVKERIVSTRVNDWQLTYKRVAFEELLIEDGGIELKALYCKFGDNEEFIEALFVENDTCKVYHAWNDGFSPK